MSKMTAAILYGKKDIRVEKVDRPTAGPGEVVVGVRAVGICGSDIHYYEEFGMGPAYQMKAPQILGHESAGVIVEVGEGVTDFKVGDRVTVEPGETCGSCPQCRSGHYNLCKDVRFLSVPGNKGAFAEYVVMGREMVFHIPDDMTYDVACLAEPLSVGIHACELCGARPGVKLMISGAGPIGLMTAAAARAFGVTEITMTDVQDNRLKFAQENCGVKNVANILTTSTQELIDQYADGVGFDCLIETSGAPSADLNCVDLVRKGGFISLVGIPKEENVLFDIFDIIDKEVTLRGVFRYVNSYPTAIQILGSGIVDFEKMITNRFTLEQTGEALDFALNNKKTAIKTVIVNREEVAL